MLVIDRDSKSMEVKQEMEPGQNGFDGSLYDFINADNRSTCDTFAVDFDHGHYINNNSGESVDATERLSEIKKSVPNTKRVDIFVDNYVTLLPSEIPTNPLERIDVDSTGPSSCESTGRNVCCFDSPEKMHAQSTECYEVARRLRMMIPSTSDYEMVELDSSDSDSSCSGQGSSMDDLAKIMHTALQELKLSRSRTLLAQTLNLFRSLHLSYMTIEGRTDESIQKRNSLNLSARKFRRFLNSHGWDDDLRSIHKLLIMQLPRIYLAYYLDLLRTVRSMVPMLLDYVIQHVILDRQVIAEIAFYVQRKPWDPARSLLNKFEPIDLPDKCHLLLIPPLPMQTAYLNIGQERWMVLYKQISAMLGSKCSLMKFPPIDQNLAAVDYAIECAKSIKNSLAEVNAMAPEHDLIVVAWNCMISSVVEVLLETHVSALICLAYSNVTLNGPKGDADDKIYALRCPIQFVVGQCSQTCSLYKLEDMRRGLNAESGLVVVGSANSQLHVNHSKLMTKSVTQSMVDRCIVDSILAFCASALAKTAPAVYPSMSREVESSLRGMKLLKRKYTAASDDAAVAVSGKEFSSELKTHNEENKAKMAHLSTRPVVTRALKAGATTTTTDDSTELESSFDEPRAGSTAQGLSATRTRTVKRPKQFDV